MTECQKESWKGQIFTFIRETDGMRVEYIQSVTCLQDKIEGTHLFIVKLQ